MLISVGDRVQPGLYREHSRFRRVINYSGTGGLVSLVEPEVGAGPLNIVVREIRPPQPSVLTITENAITLGDANWDILPSHRFNSDLNCGEMQEEFLLTNLNFLEKLIVDEAHPRSLVFLLDDGRITNFTTSFEQALVDRVSAGVRKIETGDTIAGVRAVKGCGFGLTPGGDDYICGMLIALNFVRRTTGQIPYPPVESIYAAARSGNLISDTFLRLAKEGRIHVAVKALLTALLHPDQTEITRCARQLLTRGETSGADFCTGLLMTVRRESHSRKEEKNGRHTRAHESHLEAHLEAEGFASGRIRFRGGVTKNKSFPRRRESRQPTPITAQMEKFAHTQQSAEAGVTQK